MSDHVPTSILDFEFRPEKSDVEFRNYTNTNAFNQRVKKAYYNMHTVQTLQHARDRMQYWCKFDHAELTIMEVVEALNTFIDESDPDVDVSDTVHSFQTAERIREVHPDKDWFQLTGLIHDIGKIMAVWGEPQHSVVGDTYPVGCAFSDKAVFGSESFVNNADYLHPVYSTKLGIYEENCGLEKVTMVWGHDEYLYQVLRNHSSCTLPEEALYMIRFHSFYPWHNCLDYMYLCDNRDTHMLNWVQKFSKFDLYSKTDVEPDVAALAPYYQSLIDKYIPGILKW